MRWTTMHRIGFLLFFGLGLSSCTVEGTLRRPAAEPTVYPPAVFAHRVASSHVVLYWNCARPEPGILRLDGVAQNPWSQQEVRFLELILAGADASDRYVSEAATALPEFLLRTNQISAFQLDLRTTGAEVRFDLFYRYRFQDGGRSFVAGHLAGAPQMLAQSISFMARDVCSETQHRVR